MIIPAPNRMVEPNNYYPPRSELPAIWSDISNAIQGFKDCSTTRLVLDEVLGLELSNFARLLKLSPGLDDDHLLVQKVANDLWFRQMDYARNEQGRTVRRNMTLAEEDIMALALRTKPHTNVWLCLSPGECTLGEDAFEHATAVVTEIHAYLKNVFDENKLAGGMMLQLMQDVNTMSLDKFQADILATRAQYERSDAILGGMGVGWTPSFKSSLSTLPEEEWERCQSELERTARVTWNRVTFMERTWDVIRRYGTQSVMKVGLNQRGSRETNELRRV